MPMVCYKIWLTLLFFCSMLVSSWSFASLVELIKISPHIRLDIRYATKKNFTGNVVYPSARCYLQKEVAVALDAVQREMEAVGLGLKIFDGYRPLSVQKIFWDVVSDRFPDPIERQKYVANPAAGSKHNRGTAVDLTLIDLKTGKELEMPSGYDDFSALAHRIYGKMLSKRARRNCKLLELVMEKHGFIGIPSEWWHFDFKAWEKYPVADVSFDELAQD